MSQTREEILALPAGKHLDAAVAQSLFGHVWLYNTRYSVLVDAEEAKLVVEGGHAKYGKHPEHEAGAWMAPLEPYSTHIEYAWRVVEAMQSQGGFFNLQNGAGGDTKGWRAELLYKGLTHDPHLCPTAALAICRAALLAKIGVLPTIEKGKSHE